MSAQQSVLAELIPCWWKPGRSSYQRITSFSEFTEAMSQKLTATYPQWRDRLDEESILISYLEVNEIRRYNTLQMHLRKDYHWNGEEGADQLDAGGVK
jgi:hypothetical protein